MNKGRFFQIGTVDQKKGASGTKIVLSNKITTKLIGRINKDVTLSISHNIAIKQKLFRSEYWFRSNAKTNHKKFV